jgi:hypothetical protein
VQAKEDSMGEQDNEKSDEEMKEEIEINVDSTVCSAAYVVGTALSGGDPNVGKAFVKFVKDLEKEEKEK